MLIKQLFHSRDFQSSLRRRTWFGLGLACLGALLVLLSRTVFQNSGLPDFIRGFYLGVGVGLVLVGLITVVHALRLMKNPAAAKKAQVTAQDEREQAIVKAAMYSVFWVFYVVLSAGVFIALPLNLAVFFTLLALLVLFSLSFLLALAWHKRHM